MPKRKLHPFTADTMKFIADQLNGVIETEVTVRLVEQCSHGVVIRPVDDDAEPPTEYYGDAGMAQGRFFRFVMEGDSVTIYCPTFLRGPLTFSTDGSPIRGASY